MENIENKFYWQVRKIHHFFIVSSRNHIIALQLFVTFIANVTMSFSFLITPIDKRGSNGCVWFRAKLLPFALSSKIRSFGHVCRLEGLTPQAEQCREENLRMNSIMSFNNPTTIYPYLRWVSSKQQLPAFLTHNRPKAIPPHLHLPGSCPQQSPPSRRTWAKWSLPQPY